MRTPTKTSYTDVLIVGAGPAGLFLSAQLAKILEYDTRSDPDSSGVARKFSVRVIDKSAERVDLGHADGFQCRTVEIFKSLGIAERVVAEGNEVAEVVFYNPTPSGSGVEETSRLPDTEPGTSYYKHVLLGQGRVEQFLMDCARDAAGIEVERNTTPQTLSYPRTPFPPAASRPPSLPAGTEDSEYPISVTVTHLPPPAPTTPAAGKSGLYRSNLFTENPNARNVEGAADAEGTPEEIRCRYLVGCDGARSWVRRAMGLKLEGDASDAYFGVVDVRADTNLPTIRMKNVIHSPSAGTVLSIPRERGLTRFYVQMGVVKPGERVDRAEVTEEKIVERLQKILAPYEIKCPEVEWFTCYEVGQRLCDQFAVDDRVFIAGDACHTHSPKAGQGMNVSMNDANNLGWKLATVLKGISKPEILSTYHPERHQVASELIGFDRKFARHFSGKVKTDDNDGISPEEFTRIWRQYGKWTTGTAVQYGASSLISTSESQIRCQPSLAKNLTIGSHFENHQVVCCADAKAIQLQHELRCDGRWRLILFPGDFRNVFQMTSLRRLSSVLDAEDGPIRRFTRKNDDIDSVVQVLTVFSTPRKEVVGSELPEILQPRLGKFGIRTWETIFSDDSNYHDGHGKAYEGYGVDPNCSEGCIIVVRPDQYVSAIVGFEHARNLGMFFESVLIEQTQ